MDQANLEVVQILSLEGIKLLRILVSLFISILFLQSGLDKVFDWKGNVGYFTSHFSKSPLKGTVPILMPIITIFEVAAGVLSLLGVILYLANDKTNLAIWGMLLASLSIIQLFFGQRLAKDYAGAAVLVPYFLVTIVGLYLYLV